MLAMLLLLLSLSLLLLSLLLFLWPCLRLLWFVVTLIAIVIAIVVMAMLAIVLIFVVNWPGWQLRTDQRRHQAANTNNYGCLQNERCWYCCSFLLFHGFFNNKQQQKHRLFGKHLYVLCLFSTQVTSIFLVMNTELYWLCFCFSISSNNTSNNRNDNNTSNSNDNSNNKDIMEQHYTIMAMPFVLLAALNNYTTQ